MQARTLYGKLSVTFLFVFPNKIIIIVVACESFGSKAAILAAISKRRCKFKACPSHSLRCFTASLPKLSLHELSPWLCRLINDLNPQICYNCINLVMSQTKFNEYLLKLMYCFFYFLFLFFIFTVTQTLTEKCLQKVKLIPVERSTKS